MGAREDRVEALGLQELVRDVEGGLDLADAEELDDVGVLELGRELHLVHQALDHVPVGGQVGPDAQHDHDLLEPSGAQLRRPVLRPQPRGFDFLEEDELPELLSLRHGRASGAGSSREKIARRAGAFNFRGLGSTGDRMSRCVRASNSPVSSRSSSVRSPRCRPRTKGGAARRRRAAARPSRSMPGPPPPAMRTPLRPTPPHPRTSTSTTWRCSTTATTSSSAATLSTSTAAPCACSPTPRAATIRCRSRSRSMRRARRWPSRRKVPPPSTSPSRSRSTAAGTTPRT